MFKNINDIIWKPHESLEYSTDSFVHICYQFTQTDMDLMYLGEKLW